MKSLQLRKNARTRGDLLYYMFKDIEYKEWLIQIIISHGPISRREITFLTRRPASDVLLHVEVLEFYGWVDAVKGKENIYTITDRYYRFADMRAKIINDYIPIEAWVEFKNNKNDFLF